MFYTYKTTISDGPFKNHYYIGKSSSPDPKNHKYIGSGILLTNLSKIYSVKKEILFFHSNEDEAYQKEADLVTHETILDPLCLNLRVGGHGGWEGSNSKHGSWDYYDELLNLWKTSDYLGYVRFGRLVIKRGYPIGNYYSMIKRFESDTGIKSKSNTRTLGTPSSRRKQHWNYENVLYKLWCILNNPGHRTFAKIAIEKGYPNVSYYAMVEKFKCKNYSQT